MSSILQFKLENLNELDGGKALLAFEEHIRRAARDCMDRPGEAKARKVTMQVEFVPLMQPGGDCTEVNAAIQVKSTVPTHKTKTYSFGLRKNGVVTFNPDSPTDINQGTLLEDQED